MVRFFRVSTYAMKKPLLIITILFICLFASLSYAQTKVQALGTADIQRNFVQIARDRATDNAKKMAVEKAVRVYIESETLVENYALVYDRIFSRFSGYINSFEIIEEKREGAQYLVRIEADVGAERLKRDLDSILRSLLAEKSNPRLMVLFREQSQKDFIAEGVMIEYFLSKGFKIVDSETIRNNTGKERLNALGTDKGITMTVGRSYGAEIIIVGSVAATSHLFKLGEVEMHSNRANVTAKVIKSDTGDIMASGNQEHKMPGIKDMIKKPVEQATRKLAEDLTEKIVAWWQKELSGTMSVRLIVKGIDSYNEGNVFIERLPNEARGIKNVYQRSSDQGRL